MDRSNKKFKIGYKCTTANTSAIRQHGSMLYIPPTNLLLLAAKQEPYKKAHLLAKKKKKNFLEKVQENGPAGRNKHKTERVTGLGRRPREEMVKWNQMTVLRFQTGGRHQTSPASLKGMAQSLQQ